MCDLHEVYILFGGNGVDYFQTTHTEAVSYGATPFVEEVSKTFQQTIQADVYGCD